SWDFGMLNDRLKNGQPLPAAPVWQVYNGETIKLAKGDTLYINAMRIGYKLSVVKYMNGQTIPDNQVKSTVRSQ
ncbi:MAG: hypothetical protein ICV84_00865, partial [Flavisolibacter sp.]|nr:hypothetical protein [Flavisolibacter sp.]